MLQGFTVSLVYCINSSCAFISIDTETYSRVYEHICVHTYSRINLAYLVSVVCRQQVGGQRLQLVLGHVLECRQAAAGHGLLQVDGRVAQGVHGGRGQLVTGVQDLHRSDAHHTAVQGSWREGREGRVTQLLGHWRENYGPGTKCGLLSVAENDDEQIFFGITQLKSLTSADYGLWLLFFCCHDASFGASSHNNDVINVTQSFF